MHLLLIFRPSSAGDDEISSLKGWALAHHWRLVRLADEYHLPSCEVPNPW